MLILLPWQTTICVSGSAHTVTFSLLRIVAVPWWLVTTAWVTRVDYNWRQYKSVSELLWYGIDGKGVKRGWVYFFTWERRGDSFKTSLNVEFRLVWSSGSFQGTEDTSSRWLQLHRRCPHNLWKQIPFNHKYQVSTWCNFTNCSCPWAPTMHP